MIIHYNLKFPKKVSKEPLPDKVTATMDFPKFRELKTLGDFTEMLIFVVVSTK